MLRKSYPVASFKAFKDDTGELTGEFEAIVSVFGNVDRVGDRVVKGAFAKSLALWKDSGDPIPVLWSHDWMNPDSHIGVIIKAEERDVGLWVKGALDIKSNARAATVAKLLAERRVKEWSFSYEVNDEKKARDGANELLDLGIIEVGPTLKGINPATQTVDAKAYIPLAGSTEERQSAISDAVHAWGAANYPSDESDEGGMYAYIEGTFEDRVVFTVSVWGEEPSKTTYQAGYTIGGDGVTLDEPVEVELQAVVTEKSLDQKAGRVLSKKNETDLRTAADLLNAVLAQVSDSDDEKAAKAAGNASPDAEANGKARPTPLSVLAAVGIDDDEL